MFFDDGLRLLFGRVDPVDQRPAGILATLLSTMILQRADICHAVLMMQGCGGVVNNFMFLHLLAL